MTSVEQEISSFGFIAADQSVAAKKTQASRVVQDEL
jgi:hypothetical protein